MLSGLHLAINWELALAAVQKVVFPWIEKVQESFPSGKECGNEAYSAPSRQRHVPCPIVLIPACICQLMQSLRSRHYCHPPLRFSSGRILMNASTAWILPS
jgi:hypothetical protein